jgi:hypothetical protein
MRADIHVDGGFVRRGGNLNELQGVWTDSHGTVRQSERFGLVEYLTIVAALYVTKPFWGKFGEKVGEKLGEAVGEDLARMYRACSSTVQWAIKAAAGTTVRLVWEHFSEQDDIPKLIATCDSTDENEHSRALDGIDSAVAEYEKVVSTFQPVGFILKEVHFTWEGEVWSWAYALTRENTVLGPAERALLEAQSNDASGKHAE